MNSAIRRGWVVAGFLLALVAEAGAADAANIFACVNNASGSVKIVSANAVCAQNETLLTWNVAGPTGPQGPAGAPGAPGSQGPAGERGSDGGLLVIDNNGQTVGTWLFATTGDWFQERVLMKLGQDLFTLFITANGFGLPYNVATNEDFLYFDGPGCTGTGYYYATDDNGTADNALVGYGTYRNGQAFVRDRSQSRTGLATFISSYLTPFKGAPDCHAAGFVWGENSLRPAKAIDVSGFQGPFSLQ